MPTSPAASPSSPSTRLTAFTVITMSSTVTGTPRSGESTTVPASGSQNDSTRTPNRVIVLATQICAASLAGAVRPMVSSIMPITTMRAAPMATPSTSETTTTGPNPGRPEARNRGWNASMREARARPPRKPAKIASPPRVGVGMAWTLRPPGRSTASSLSATKRTTGVIR